MANQEHLSILDRGQGEWDAWRRGNNDVVADLCGATLAHYDLQGINLSGANLRGTNLSGASLRDANFRGANLIRADLSAANLMEAKLCKTDLRVAKLEEANLIEADLEGANLKEADLGAANLRRANLRWTNLEGTTLGETILVDVDLKMTENLEKSVHAGPSSVDQRTLARSRGVPSNFWRGCGLPDWQIEAAKLYLDGLDQDDVISITYEIARIRGEQPIQLFSPFISYSSQDGGFARRLYNCLQNSGVRCWFAPEDMKIGDRIRPRIDDVIHLRDKLLLVLSEHSLQSQWVEQEVETALEKERETGESVLFPIKVDYAVDEQRRGWPSLIRKTRHIGDFTNWEDDATFEKAFDRVLRDLRAMP